MIFLPTFTLVTYLLEEEEVTGTGAEGGIKWRSVAACNSLSFSLVSGHLLPLPPRFFTHTGTSIDDLQQQDQMSQRTKDCSKCNRGAV
ncbi:putative protein RMD5-like protein A [Iris pallida]|uniref:Uncharacterized protein n=1 Tax=Iris pallida TaxID=29817 RepID=A0AAX6DQV2_IRIPA|nr:putative protein RMD5-like protein A [Iris pallida]